MAKVKLDFKRLPIAEKIVRARQIIKNLTGNPDFPNPNPPLAQITTISGLTSGVRYWFRVAAIGASGQSGWSDPATKIAP